MTWGYSGLCPKCGGTMGGPTFIRDRAFGTEHLHYRCTTCGYDEKRPTKDAKQANAFQQAIRNAGGKP